MGGPSLVIATLALVLAGCVADPPPVAQPAAAPEADEESFLPVPPTPRAESTIGIAFAGTYPNAAYVCHATISCRGIETGSYENDVKVPVPVGNITSIHLTMTWSAPAPNMETLGLAAMAMFPRDCADCPKSVEFAITKGKSPLSLDASGLSVPIDPRGVLHVYFYPLNTVNGPVPIEVDAETRVHVEGTATLQH